MCGAAKPTSVVSPIAGLPAASAIPRAAEMPTRSPVKLPGPVVTAMRSISRNSTPASSMTLAISGISASACPRAIGRVSDARMPPRPVSRTAAAQASSAVSMARMRMADQSADDRIRITINRTSPAVRSHRPDFDHVGHVMLQQVLDAVTQGGGRRRAARAGPLHVEEDDPVLEAPERDVAAVVLDRGTHPRLDQLFNDGDRLGVLGVEEL